MPALSCYWCLISRVLYSAHNLKVLPPARGIVLVCSYHTHSPTTNRSCAKTVEPVRRLVIHRSLAAFEYNQTDLGTRHGYLALVRGAGPHTNNVVQVSVVSHETLRTPTATIAVVCTRKQVAIRVVIKILTRG